MKDGGHLLVGLAAAGRDGRGLLLPPRTRGPQGSPPDVPRPLGEAPELQTFEVHGALGAHDSGGAIVLQRAALAFPSPEGVLPAPLASQATGAARAKAALDLAPRRTVRAVVGAFAAVQAVDSGVASWGVWRRPCVLGRRVGWMWRRSKSWGGTYEGGACSVCCWRMGMMDAAAAPARADVSRPRLWGTSFLRCDPGWALVLWQAALQLPVETLNSRREDMGSQLVLRACTLC